MVYIQACRRLGSRRDGTGVGGQMSGSEQDRMACKAGDRLKQVLSGYCKMKNVGAGKDTCSLEQDG